MIYLQLFWAFIQVGLFSIGGGYAAMPIIQSQVVDKYGWITMNEFTDLITIAEMTPGPIAVNSATFTGIRIAGIAGAIVATIGCILPSCFIVSALAFIYYKYKKLSAMQTVLACLRPAVVALIASAGLTILLNALEISRFRDLMGNFNLLNALLFAGAFLFIHFGKKNPILTMLGCGVLYTCLNLLLVGSV